MNNNYKRKLKIASIGVGLIFFWRGVWHSLDIFFDEYLYPDNHMIGNLICITLGLCVVFFTDYDNF
jgi:hypothetical protein